MVSDTIHVPASGFVRVVPALRVPRAAPGALAPRHAAASPRYIAPRAFRAGSWPSCTLMLPGTRMWTFTKLFAPCDTCAQRVVIAFPGGRKLVQDAGDHGAILVGDGAVHEAVERTPHQVPAPSTGFWIATTIAMIGSRRSHPVDCTSTTPRRRDAHGRPHVGEQVGARRLRA